jgi:FKBP-type peptidyl-prolyl cis-trans isomerase
MATPKSQRIGIWIIAIVMTLGMLGSFLVMGLSVKNQSVDTAQLQTAYNQYQLALATQATDLSSKYYEKFSNYTSLPATFTASDVKTLVKEDLKVGTGAEIKSSTAYSAYYIGWNPKGVVFDESISSGSLKSPISSGGSLITGWTEGVIGMKIGGVRELTIPSDKAYGATGSGTNIPANTPIKFVIMAIPKAPDVMPEILKEYYAANSQQ